MKKHGIIFLVFALLFSCDKEDDYDKAKAVSLLNLSDKLSIDESLANQEVRIPKSQKNNIWLGSASLQNQRVENISKDFSIRQKGYFFNKRDSIFLKKLLNKLTFYSGDSFDNFVFSPIIIENNIYFLDSSGELTSIDLQNKKTLWKKQVFKKSWLKNYKIARIGACQNKIFAIAGIDQIKAISQSSGEILWQKDLSSILTSTPICDDKMVFVATDNNKIFALNSENGDIIWFHSGVARMTAILGNSDPVIYDDNLIVSYSSGEVYALDKKTGEVKWSQDLNLSKATNSDFYLNDVDATPLVKNDVVYAIGNGGLMKAISLKKGDYIWKKEIASIVDFWLAGDFLFIITNDDKLIAVNNKTGGIKWISQLPDFKNPKKLKTKFIYSGIVMAGNKLLISRSDGELIIASPLDGKIEETFSFGRKIFHSPAVVNGKIYLYSIGRFTIELTEIE